MKALLFRPVRPEACRSHRCSIFLSRSGLALWMALVCSPFGARVCAAPVHPWETLEITLQADETCADPYARARVWVDLEGPGFSQRCYSFWDGGNITIHAGTCPGLSVSTTASRRI
jgi:hypothetical protein